MELICKHDPSDPDHLICETKHSPIYNWFKKRWDEFYCKGPKCSKHRAYTHLAVDGTLVLIIIWLVLTIALVFFENRRVKERLPSFEEKVDEIAIIEDIIEEIEDIKDDFEVKSLYLNAQALYFSKEGEQLGRGSWPMVIGETTKLKVYIKPIIGEDFQNVVIKGHIPQGIKWTGFVPIGKYVLYEPESRIFTIDAQNNDEIVFEVAITPYNEYKDIFVVDEVYIIGINNKTGERRKVQFPNVVIP